MGFGRKSFLQTLLECLAELRRLICDAKLQHVSRNFQIFRGAGRIKVVYGRIWPSFVGQRGGRVKIFQNIIRQSRPMAQIRI